MIPSTSPAEAYASDLARLGRSVPIGNSDDAWLVLAHALHRFSQLAPGEAQQMLPQIADTIAINTVSVGLSPQSSLMRCARALAAMSEPTHVMENGNTAAMDLFVATQSVAEEQELGGAFGLAFAMLHGLSQAFSDRVPPRAQGNVLAQMGRAARQLGASDLAHEYYDEAMQVGYDADALDVVARALLGIGVLALTRGNYPTAREQFERALVNADRACDTELSRSAHHGLLNCSFASGDLDSALVHGWNVLRLCIAPDSRAEALMNMAEICRLTGEHDAAIRVYTVAMEWTSQKHVRLCALTGAMQSSVALGLTADARRLCADIALLMPTVTDTYSRCAVGVDVAEALHRLGDIEMAQNWLTEAASSASVNQFHELVHRAEHLAVAKSKTAAHMEPTPIGRRRRRRTRSDSFRMVLRSLRGLAASTS